ncbi:Uncharacterised protein [Acinetobacter baumannii]|nr:Uncharacterised protein [Acinetobacter baumannii]
MARRHREEIGPNVDGDRIEPGGAGAERHQGIHGGAAVHQRAPGVAVEVPAGEHHYRQGDDADQQPGALGFRRQRHAAAEQPPGHQRNTQRQPQRRLPAKALHVGAGGLLLTFAAFGFVLNHLGAVAGFFHRRHQRLRIGGAGHQRAALRQVDARMLHAGNALQRLLHLIDAAGAGHAAEQQLYAVVRAVGCRKRRLRRWLNVRQRRCCVSQRLSFWDDGARHAGVITGMFHRGDQRLRIGIAVHFRVVYLDLGGEHARHRFQRLAGAADAVHAAQAAQLQFGVGARRDFGLIAGGDHAVDQCAVRRFAGHFGVMDVNLRLFDIAAAFQGFFHPLRAVHAGQPLQCQHSGV